MLSSARVTTNGLPTGRHPCDTTVRHRHRRPQEGADRALGDHPVVDHQPVAARAPRPADAMPADHGQAGRSWARRGEEGVGREAEGVGDEQQGAGVVGDLVGPAGERRPVGRGRHGEVEGRHGARCARPTATPPGVPLDLPAATDHRHGGAAQQGRRAEGSPGRRPAASLQSAGVGRGDEQHGQVGRAIGVRLSTGRRRRSPGRRPRRRRLAGVGMLREAGGERGGSRRPAAG